MSKNINYKIAFLLSVILLISISFASSLTTNSTNQSTKIMSNESMQAKDALVQAEKDISEMLSKGIGVLRVNETYQEAYQTYLAQVALEEKMGRANYENVIKDCEEINSVKETSLEANDELTIFIRNYQEAEKEANLSEMQVEYNAIITSFNEERFEDTLKLINQGYQRVSEIQSSQTAMNSLYLATSRTIKNFFIKNKIKIAVTLAVILLLVLIFWNTLTRLDMKRKLNNLIIRKKAVNGLIKEMQDNYFKKRNISESEYLTKLKKFEELIRDIDRQTMVLKEEMLKMNMKIN
ncbi:MAG: hypothetical protein ACP5NZ_04535 [Nanobdellota archaeon]